MASPGTFLQAIKDLKWLRIDAWKETAESKEPKPGEAALEIIIAVVSEGLGGVVYGVIDKMLENSAHHLVAEFAALAGLEAGDLAAEALFHKALQEDRRSLQQGTQKALGASKKSSQTALATDTDIISAYAEALKLQSVEEFVQQSADFQDPNPEDSFASQRAAALQLTYGQLLADPSPYLRELTIGFIRLLDEVTLGEKDKEHDGNRERTWKEDDEVQSIDMRLGSLSMFPWPRNHSLGKWSKPDLGLSEFNASVLGGVNTKTLARLVGTPIADLPLSMSFRFKVDDPFHRLFKGDLGLTEVWFTRQPNGAVHPTPDIEDDAMEWLASFYTGDSREFTDQERWIYGLLGVQKLYDATKHTPIGQINKDY